MTEGWAYGGAPHAGASGASVTIVEGRSFCVSDDVGDVHPGSEHGLYVRDTRFLSRFALTVDGRALESLVAHAPQPYAAELVARRPPSQERAEGALLVVRRRYVGDGLLERITVRNVGAAPAAALLELRVDADFAGLFEVKEGRAAGRPGMTRAAGRGELRLAVRTPRGSKAVTVASADEPRVDEDRLAWPLELAPRGEVTVTVQVVPEIDGLLLRLRYRADEPIERSAPAEELVAWRRQFPAVSSGDARLGRLLARSAADLGALRISDEAHPGRSVVAAGAPWFMTLFGRDALLTSWMLLPVDPSLALGTLQTLAELQGAKDDLLTEEEPGRILHEVRSGLDAEDALGGGQVYYGTADATPLFVALLGELRRFGLAGEEVDRLLPHADRALDWITEHGDRDGDGFVEYQRASERGLVNQGWKDSFDAINFADGRLAEPPIALAEAQGYAYAAFLARADLAKEAGEDDVAARWAAAARELKERFNAAFWLPDRGYYAIALDGAKRPVDALASNMGHCLWTGIVDEDKAPSVARRLLSPELFTGYGVRTLATSMGAYNPMSYHNGSVWPHDNAIVAAGLARYGFVEEAQRVALGMLDAAEAFDYRLPELLCGFDRSEFPLPVPYPTSCSPQAWAAGAPLLLLRALLRFDPSLPAGRLWCAPALPPSLLPLRIAGLRLAGARLTLAVDAAGWRVDGLPEGIELAPAPEG